MDIVDLNAEYRILGIGYRLFIRYKAVKDNKE